ncbi:hypothetical protein ACS0TY_035367 [Phlomoides rotata]
MSLESTELGLREKLAAAPETDAFTVDPIFIGRDHDVSGIVEMLTTPTEEVLSILPIVGLGLGKTTFARKIFNREKTMTHFGQHIWVHVSQDFDAVILLKKILNNSQGRNAEEESREGLLKKLQEALEAQNDEEVFLLKKKLADLEGGVVLKKIQEALKAKTYLLVLDDVWNEDQQKWEDFINSLSGITSNKGNAILVTSMNARVGSIVKKNS